MCMTLVMYCIIDDAISCEWYDLSTFLQNPALVDVHVVPCVLYDVCIIMCAHVHVSIMQALTAVSTASVEKAPWPSDSMVQIASQLLEFKADPNSQDCDGSTALHRAVQCGNPEVFNVLLSSER